MTTLVCIAVDVRLGILGFELGKLYLTFNAVLVYTQWNYVAEPLAVEIMPMETKDVSSQQIMK